MAIEWNVAGLHFKLYDGALVKTNIVTSIDWIASNQSDSGLSVLREGTLSLTYPENTTGFIEYGSLTKEIVLSWLDANLSNKATIETELEAELSALTTPVV